MKQHSEDDFPWGLWWKCHTNKPVQPTHQEANWIKSSIKMENRQFTPSIFDKKNFFFIDTRINGLKHFFAWKEFLFLSFLYELRTFSFHQPSKNRGNPICFWLSIIDSKMLIMIGILIGWFLGGFVERMQDFVGKFWKNPIKTYRYRKIVSQHKKFPQKNRVNNQKFLSTKNCHFKTIIYPFT